MAEVFINLGHIEKGRPTTFKLPYSRGLILEPEFIPKETQPQELVLGMYFSQILLYRSKRNIQGVRLAPPEKEKDKGADIIVTEDGIDYYIQVSRLLFTNYERRKQLAKQQSISFAKRIFDTIPKFNFEIVIKIFPKDKHKVPLSSVGGRVRGNIERALLLAITKVISDNVDLVNKRQRLQVDLSRDTLGQHFYSFDVYPVPDNLFANVWGHENIFVEYDFAGSTYNEQDEDIVVQDLFDKKNNGTADTLLIWCNSFELHNARRIADKLLAKFAASSFQKVYLMTFRDNWEAFMKTLELWPLK
jgi:hypothetical protein